MMLGSACSGKCCLCACGRGCIAGHGDDYFSPARKEQIIDRLDKGEYPDYTDIMKKYLKEGFGYNYDNNEREDKNMNKNFTKADLKVGYIVKLKNSTEPHMVGMNNAGDMGFVGKDGGYVRLDHYNELLADKLPHMGGDWSVMEVYGYSDFVCDAYKFTTDNRKLLWKREEERPKKTCDKCIHKVVCSHVGMCEHYMESGASK